MTPLPGDAGGGLRNTIYRRLTRSNRRMTAGRKLAYRLAVPVGLGLVRLYWRLCRIAPAKGVEHIVAALARHGSFVPCYWHQHSLFCSRFLVDLRSRGLKPGWLISPSVDGEIGAQLIQRLGGHVIRGSSTNTGARALRDYYQALVKEGLSPVITPDGPRGPRFKFKPGAILLAQMSGRPIIPLAYAASRAWLVNWDKFVLPLPSARIVVAVGAPRYVPRVTDAAAIEKLQDEMEMELKLLYSQARDGLRSASK
jgi:lysophospholipid acyltransferase (LPLAT)-like uncharacterized protein